MSNYNCYILRIEVIYVQMKMEAIFEEKKLSVMMCINYSTNIDRLTSYPSIK